MSCRCAPGSWRAVITNRKRCSLKPSRTAALKADDPFLALDSFEQQSGDYGRDCDSLGAFLFGNFASTDKACRARDEATRDMVLKAVEKGSVPALVFLFDPGSKTPDVYPRDIDPQKAGQAAERLVALAESAPVDSKNQALLMRAGDVLQAGQYVLQDSRRAAALYVKAWQAGDHAPRTSWSMSITFSRTAGVPTSGRSEQRRAAAGQSG